MPDHQLYISVGIPFFSLILVWLGTSVSNRTALVGMRTSMNELRSSISDLRDALNTRIDDTNQRIGRMEAKLDRNATEIRTGHERRLAMLEAIVFKRAG